VQNATGMVEALRQGLELDPDAEGAAEALDAAFAAAPDAVTRERVVGVVAETQPGHPLSRLMQARLAWADGDRAGAIQGLKRLYRATPDDRRAFEALLLAQVREEQDAAAMTLAQGWLDRHPRGSDRPATPRPTLYRERSGR
jgi:predicted Zn-dependent protease